MLLQMMLLNRSVVSNSAIKDLWGMLAVLTFYLLEATFSVVVSVQAEQTPQSLGDHWHHWTIGNIKIHARQSHTPCTCTRWGSFHPLGQIGAQYSLYYRDVIQRKEKRKEDTEGGLFQKARSQNQKAKTRVPGSSKGYLGGGEGVA